MFGSGRRPAAEFRMPSGRTVFAQLYHVGIRPRVARSTLADDNFANESRDWPIYSDLGHGPIRTARNLYGEEPLGVDLANTRYALLVDGVPRPVAAPPSPLESSRL